VNVDTTIYVDGGTLTINAGAKIKGNIYCYNGGTVDVKGDFMLYAPDAPKGTDTAGGIAFRTECGIFILGTPEKGDTSYATSGKLIIPLTMPTIYGTSNRIHLEGNFNELVTVGSATGSLGYVPRAGSFLCGKVATVLPADALPGYDAKGRCLHVHNFNTGGQAGGWTVGSYRE
jgi:hypothetical protein